MMQNQSPENHIALPGANTNVRIGWYLAGIGILTGAALTIYYRRIDGGALAVLSMALLFTALDQKLTPPLPFGPLSFTYLYHAFGYGIGPVWQDRVLNHLIPIESGFILAQWGGVLGLATLAVAYPYFFCKIQTRFSPGPVETEPPLSGLDWKYYTFVLTLISIFVIVFGFLSGARNRLGGGNVSILLASLASAFSAVPAVAFFFLGWATARKQRAWLFVWVLLLSAYVAFNFLDGSRGVAVYAIITSFLGLVFGGVRVRRILTIGVILAILFIPMADIVNTYRTYYNNLSSATSFGERVEGIVAAYEEFVLRRAGSLADSTQIFISAMTANSVDRVFFLTPRIIPFVYLDGIEKVVYVFMPEILHIDRPDLLDGNELAVLYGAATPGTQGSYMPAVGDGYRRGGWIGIVLLYILTAVVFAGWSSISWTRQNNPAWMATWVCIFTLSPAMWSTSLLSNFYFLLWMIPRNLLLFAAIWWLTLLFRQPFLLRYRIDSHPWLAWFKHNK